MLWGMNEAKVRGDRDYDPTSEQRIASRDAVRQEMWTKLLQTPVDSGGVGGR